MDRTIQTDIENNLKMLHLPAMRECYDELAVSALAESLSYHHYLLELTDRECQSRINRKIERLLRQSRLPLHKTMNTLEMNRFPAKVRQQIATLRDGSFLSGHENILAFGNPGTGKTHILCALGHELIKIGKRVLFMPCSLLVQDLLAAKRGLTLKRLIKQWSNYDAVIIDDIG